MALKPQSIKAQDAYPSSGNDEGWGGIWVAYSSVLPHDLPPKPGADPGHVGRRGHTAQAEMSPGLGIGF